MIDRIPRRLRVAFTGHDDSTDPATVATTADGREQLDFVAYGEDCVLSGRTVLDGDRLSDMLNEHDEYDLIGVTVERFDGGSPMEVDEVVVQRDELWLVHATGPRGNVARRHRTAQQYVAMKMGQYEVRGFYHALPGTDPVTALQRRKPMVPLTDARIEFTLGGEVREARVATLVFNRDKVEWVTAVEPDRAEFPLPPQRLQSDPT